MKYLYVLLKKYIFTACVLLIAVSLLAPGGILLVAVYPGHEEGRLEGEAIAELLSQKSRFEMSVGRFQFINSPTSPYFFIIEKKEPRA